MDATINCWIENQKLSIKKLLILLLQPDSGLLFPPFSSEVKNGSQFLVQTAKNLAMVHVK
jgi:hypothetical protein